VNGCVVGIAVVVIHTEDDKLIVIDLENVGDTVLLNVNGFVLGAEDGDIVIVLLLEYDCVGVIEIE